MGIFNRVSALFAASLLVLFSTSAPIDGFIKVKNIDTEEDIRMEQVGNFYDLNSFNSKIVEPVIKLNFVFETPIESSVMSTATGFSVGYDKSSNQSYIVTNDHFCENKDDLPLGTSFYYDDHKMPISRKKTFESRRLLIVKRDSSKDLCLMIADGYIKPAKIASSGYTVKQMEQVTIVGGPAGLFPVLLKTHISNVFTRDVLPLKMRAGGMLYLLSEQIFGGQSGSPIFNQRGEVIGVIFMSISNIDGPVYGGVGIPLSDLRGFLKDTPVKI